MAASFSPSLSSVANRCVSSSETPEATRASIWLSLWAASVEQPRTQLETPTTTKDEEDHGERAQDEELPVDAEDAVPAALEVDAAGPERVAAAPAAAAAMACAPHAAPARAGARWGRDRWSGWGREPCCPQRRHTGERSRS